MKGVQNAMRGSKDAPLAFAVRTFFNARLGSIAELTDLSLDTARRQASVRLLLRGERDWIDLRVGEYGLDRKDGHDWLTLIEVGASREWLSALLHQFAVGRPFVISPGAAKALRLLT